MFLLVLVFGIYPVAKSVEMSFTASGTSLAGDPEYVGLENYAAIFDDDYFLESLRITVVFTAFSVPANIAAALGLALFFGSGRLRRGSVLFKLAVFLPVVVPIMATSVVWKWMYNSDFGAVNAALEAFGLPAFGGLSDSGTVLLALGIVELWKHVGLYTVVFLTNLQLIDKELYEAAYLEGAGYLCRTRLITLPELRPAFSLNFVYATIQFLKTFAVALVMTQGGPNYASNFVSYYAYGKFKLADYGEAAAMGTVLFALVIAVTFGARALSRSVDGSGEAA